MGEQFQDYATNCLACLIHFKIDGLAVKEVRYGFFSRFLLLAALLLNQDVALKDPLHP